MIEIRRRLALGLRAVFHRALNLSSRGSAPAICFATGPDGMRVSTRSADAAVEYHGGGEFPHEEMWLPPEFLSDVEGRKDDPVQLEVLDNGHVLAGWRDGNVPQMIQYDPAKSADTDDFPGILNNGLAENAPRLLTALHDAMLTTDAEAIRYATDHIQVRGSSGTLVATDGRQMLLQNGFEFPWDDDVLIRRTKVFGSKELPQDGPVAIGRTGDWLAVRVGPWTIFLKIAQEKRFPKVDHDVPRPEYATARFRMSQADAAFLLKSLPKLPGDEEFNLPVTVELNGSVAIRATAADQPRPTELVLSGSTVSGEPIRINTNRRFLARAIQLGFNEVHLYTPEVPVLCRDDHRHYVWALLSPESAILPTADAIRIASPTAGQKASTTRRKPRKGKATQ